MDALNVIESTDLKPKEKVDFDDKNLDEMSLPERMHCLNEAMEFIEKNEDVTDDEKSIVDKIKGSVATKCLAWGWLIKNLQEAQEVIDMDTEFRKKQIKENERKKQVIQNKINSRAVFLNQLMHELGKKKISGPTHSVVLQKQRDKLEIDPDLNIEEYPHELYSLIPESVKWNLSAVKEHLKQFEMEGFRMKKQPMKLVVK